MAQELRRYGTGGTRLFNVFPVTRNMPGAATMRISMNIQEENSARYFRVQSEHEQTLISNIPKYSRVC